ncbi:unnamed protein product [Adineta ricciae]|uniref:Uncharacterized protein n=1 Tax=Adineta ricciae TaxID=249248 RepID=A0A814H8H0_ADIRI|nr:unnamed protein product [Adineta ricciae]CAF1462348.1 unnamed protein product [Adineta ricciae]
MTSNTSRRHPLKRVRPDNENQGSFISSNEQTKKKLCRQSSEDSAFVENEKSSDERAFDLFRNEYFLQFRPYFKHRPIVTQFIEHLWSNMTEPGKVSFVKKILKEQGIYDISSRNFHENETFSNDENDFQINKSLNENRANLPTWKTDNNYSRSFINDLLNYMKYSITPRFTDKKLSAKIPAPLRRSSRIRRAPSKCSCSSCITTHGSEEHSTSMSNLVDGSEYRMFQHLIDHFHQLDDQLEHRSTEDPTPMPLSEINESITAPIVSEVPIEQPSYSTEYSTDSAITSAENDCSINNSDERPTRRTYVILTELDEPFFGPYSIEFTITI